MMCRLRLKLYVAEPVREAYVMGRGDGTVTGNSNNTPA